MKKFFSFLCILAMPMMLAASNLCDPDFPLPLDPYIDPTKPLDPNQKSPVCVPLIYQDDHELTFGTSCDGYTLQLLDEYENVVYSIVISTGTATLNLPATLSGTYTIEIICDNITFVGEIEL